MWIVDINSDEMGIAVKFKIQSVDIEGHLARN